SFPFLEPGIADFSSGAPVPLYLNVFHPRLRSLYFIGLVQPVGCIWPLSELQARIVACDIKGTWRRPADMEGSIRRQTHNPHFRWANTYRHAIEVDYHTYRRELERELSKAA